MKDLLDMYHSRAKALVTDQPKYLEVAKLQKGNAKIKMRIEKIEREFFGKWSGGKAYECKGFDGNLMIELKIQVKDFDYTHWQMSSGTFMHLLSQFEGDPTGWAWVGFEKNGAITVPVVQEIFESLDQANPEKEIPLTSSVAA